MLQQSNMERAKGTGTRLLLLLLCVLSAACLAASGPAPSAAQDAASRLYASNHSARAAQEVPEPWELINVLFYVEKFGCDLRKLEKKLKVSSVRMFEYEDRRAVRWKSLTKKGAKELCYISSTRERQKCCAKQVGRARDMEELIKECMDEAEEYFEWQEDDSLHLGDDEEHYLEKELALLSKVVEIQMASEEEAEEVDDELGSEQADGDWLDEEEYDEELAEDHNHGEDHEHDGDDEGDEAHEHAGDDEADEDHEHDGADEGDGDHEHDEDDEGDEDEDEKTPTKKKRQKKAKKAKKAKEQKRQKKQRQKQKQDAKERYREWKQKQRQNQARANASKKAQSVLRFVLRMKGAELATLASAQHALPARVREQYEQFRRALRRCFRARLMGTFFKKAERRWMACSMLRFARARVGYCADVREMDARDTRLRRAPVHCFEAGRMALLRSRSRATAAVRAAGAAAQADEKSSAVFVDLLNNSDDVCLDADVSRTCYALCCDTMYYGSHFCRDAGTTCLG